MHFQSAGAEQANSEPALIFGGNPLFQFRDRAYFLDVEGSFLYRLSPQTASQAAGESAKGPLTERIQAKLAWKRIRRRLHPLTQAEQAQERQRLAGANQELAGLWLGVAHVCNLACRYCFANEPAYLGRNQLMREGVALEALDFLVQNSGERRSLSVTFFGGEPLLNLPVIEAVVRRCREIESQTGKHVGFTMTTNGTLLTREVFLRLRSWGIRPMVSMDGTKKLHDSQRPFKNGAPSWDTITDNLAKIGPEVRELAVRATVPDADTDLVDCLVTLQKLGFSEIRLSGLCPNSGMPVNQQDFEFETWKRRYLQLMDYVLATAQGPEEIPEGGMRADVLSLKNRRRTYFCCGTGRYYYYVDPAGDLYPCFRLMTEDRRERLGKLGEPIDPLKASAFLETNVLTTQCRSCWARYLCGGPCFGDAFFSFGDYATPHALTCQQKKFRLQSAAYVLDKLSEKEHTS